MNGLFERVASAPITWGVSEVPGWGHQLSPARVLREMRELGLRASELGPDGYFALDRRVARQIESSGFLIIAGFIPVVYREATGLSEAMAGLDQATRRLSGTGAELAVLAVASDQKGYEAQLTLDARGWAALAKGLKEASELVRRRGLTPVVHPHYGTWVSTALDVERLLDLTDLDLCLDTGHIGLAGHDPVEIAAAATDRVRHVHLKDVDLDMAERVRRGLISYHQAVRNGLYPALGRGGAGVEKVIRLLEKSGYRGWYVLEQDMALAGAPSEGAGPIKYARRSVEFLMTLDRDLNGTPPDGEKA